MVWNFWCGRGRGKRSASPGRRMEKRKSPRLQGYDYSMAGVYFMTICTLSRRNLFWGDGYENTNQISYPECLNTTGRKVVDLVAMVSRGFDSLTVHNFVVMPDHIHFLVQIEGFQENRTKITDFIAVLKSLISKEIHKIDGNIQVWQRSFHDRIVRNEEEMERISLYIDMNPENWMEAREIPDF